ncbi:MAG: hypothetical protein GX556_10325 [Fibrobacter sp.]|nr:hypothetical protein [Fibrobacter sp.]
MKKLFIIILISLPAILTAGSAGRWDIGGKVGLEQNNSSLGLKAAVKAEYMISEMITWRTDFEVMLPELNDVARVDISVPSNLLYYPFASRFMIDPYIGPGLTYRHTWDNDNQLGLNLLSGVNFRVIRDQVFGIEAKYTFLLVPVIKGYWDIGLTGTWELSFGK